MARVKDPAKRYPIRFQRKIVGYLNASLVERRSVPEESVKELLKLHRKLHKLYAQMESTSDTDILTLRNLANQVTDVEFKQQRLWGFSVDYRMTNWYKVPHCRCPKMDNADARGTDYQVISEGCPIHGMQNVIVIDTEEKLLEVFGRMRDMGMKPDPSFLFRDPFLLRVSPSMRKRFRASYK